MQNRFAHFTPIAFHSAAATAVAAAVLVTALPAMAQPVPAPQVAARSWMLTDDNGGSHSGSGGESDRSAAPVARSQSLPPPAYGFEFHDLDGLPWFACWANGANPSAGRASGMLHVPSPRVRDETCVRAHRTPIAVMKGLH